MTATHGTAGTIGQATPESEAPDLDTARVEEFAGTVLQMIADASTALSLSIGHRTGLFDGMAGLPPSTSQGVADATGLQERYVREWLAAMLVGGVVEHDPLAGTWYLPPEHGAVLTRQSGKDNLAKLAQLIGLMASVEHRLVTCFRQGGGVPYSAYTEFHALMSEDSKDMAEALLVDDVLPLVDGLRDGLSRGISVADVGCGSGHHLNVLASAFPASTFVGYDFSEEAIAVARSTARSRGLANVRFEVRDVTDLSGTGPFASSPPSTPSTTRPTRRQCSPVSPRLSRPMACSSCATSAPPADRTRTSGCRARGSCTASR